ncbi:ribosome-associated translation inhibitor RaiA [Gramella sp. BOM4]|nr:ribosome-associated translation inhibitor RaiA [Christiangramia bathymodioli]
MEAIFEFVNIDRSEALESFTRKKLEKLENKYDWIVRANVYFKRNEDQKPNGYICEIRLSAPGPLLFAESNESSYEAAVSKSTSDIDRQCSKRKDKMNAH